jgi:large subunit ribosomal protein L4
MANCEIRDWQGKAAGTASLDLKVAKETSANDLVHRAVVRQLAHARQGTASTLTRAEVAGGGRKPYKQKGTGRARQGSIRTPLRPGGGVVFGPKPRTYNLAMNRKERRLALRTALMSRTADITVVKGFASGLETPKTKEIIAALGRFGIADGTKVLVVLDAPSEVVRRSVRNLEKVKLIAADQLNVFDLLHANSLVVSEEALAKIQEVYGDD